MLSILNQCPGEEDINPMNLMGLILYGASGGSKFPPHQKCTSECLISVDTLIGQKNYPMVKEFRKSKLYKGKLDPCFKPFINTLLFIFNIDDIFCLYNLVTNALYPNTQYCPLLVITCYISGWPSNISQGIRNKA